MGEYVNGRTMTGGKTGRVVIVGAGINGLVAANYLRRAGFQVTLLERKKKVGGACVSATLSIQGKKIEYALGASVIGMMQNFVFEETGLAKEVRVFTPSHPEMISFKDEAPVLHFNSITRFAKELGEKWNEKGNVEGFRNDLDTVLTVIRRGYRSGTSPSVREVTKVLGRKLVSLWITGSARDLLDHYFTSEKTKTFMAIPVTESGPVFLDEPYSAFNITLMASGSVLGGKWGFVKGGIWKISDALARINKKLGVRIITGAEVTKLARESAVVYHRNGQQNTEPADIKVFATDPLSAAKILNDKRLTGRIHAKRLVGTSGKLTLIFKRPVRWKNDTGARDFHAAFRTLILQKDLASFSRSMSAAAQKGVDYSPGYLEIYPEGPAMELMGVPQSFHVVSVLVKDIGPWKYGRDLPKLRRSVANLVLAGIENSSDFVKAILLTPKDFEELFFLPCGNIDHVELAHGQTFATRTYSSRPTKSFYQFGDKRDIYYCGAGSYPCGSVAGTPGYMCATAIIKAESRK